MLCTEILQYEKLTQWTGSEKNQEVRYAVL